MFQLLTSLEDDDVDAILEGVRKWCEMQNVSLESADGRYALNVAINAICSSRMGNLLVKMQTDLDEKP